MPSTEHPQNWPQDIQQPLAVVKDASPFALSTWEDMEKMAKQVASSGMFGINNPTQAICMFAIAHSEGLSMLGVLKKYHIVEGKPTMRADNMLAEFLKEGGGVIWHVRTDQIVAATFFDSRKSVTPEAEKQGIGRMEILLQLERGKEMPPKERSELYLALTKMSRLGQETIVRTYSDAVEKGLAQGKRDDQGKVTTKTNWARSARAMLTARCVTEGIRIIMPGIVVGIMETNEAMEVAEVEREERGGREVTQGGHQTAFSPDARDKQAMLNIIEQHQEEVKTATKERQRKLYGLIADLKSQVADIDYPPMESTTEETSKVVEGEFELLEPEAADKIGGGKNWKEYQVRHVGGIYKGMLLPDVGLDDLKVILESMTKKAKKNAIYREEADMIADAIDARMKEVDENAK
jgi:hypothetical protein